jgi:hypothetical protein
MFTFADNVAQNVCCQIRADDNSSTCTFTTGKSMIYFLSNCGIFNERISVAMNSRITVYFYHYKSLRYLPVSIFLSFGCFYVSLHRGHTVSQCFSIWVYLIQIKRSILCFPTNIWRFIHYSLHLYITFALFMFIALPIKAYYRICTLRHIRIEIIHGSQSVLWALTWVGGY